VRKETWPTDLADFIESRKDTPFQWGIHDCTLFAADAALAMTGTDLAASYRGTYDSEIGAARIIVAAGGFQDVVIRIKRCNPDRCSPPAVTGAETF